MSKLIANILGLGLAMAVTTEALADQNKLMALCNLSPKVQTRIATCTAIINSRKSTHVEINNALYSRGRAYSKINRPEKALKDWIRSTIPDSLLHAGPDLNSTIPGLAKICSRVKDLQTGLTACNAIISAGDSPLEYLVIAYSSRGLINKKRGEIDRALEDYARAIELAPHALAAFNNRGQLYKELGKFNAAIQDFNHVLLLNPGQIQSLYNRGRTFAELKDYRRAIADYSQALALSPQNVALLENRSSAYEAILSFDLAIEDYTNLLTLNPDNESAFYNRAFAYIKADNPKRAFEEFDYAVRQDKIDPLAYFQRGVGYQKTLDHKRAVDNFDAALHLNPRYLPALVNRAASSFRLARFKRAVIDYDTLISIEPDNSWAVLHRYIAASQIHKTEARKTLIRQIEHVDQRKWPGNLAALFFDEMKPNGALDLAAKESKLRGASQDCSIWYLLGEYHLIVGNEPLAAEDFKTASELATQTGGNCQQAEDALTRFEID